MHIINRYLEKHNNRIIGLDILRAIAILLVVYVHGTNLIPGYLHESYLSLYFNIDGVSIFFVISGFLIGGILLKIIRSSEFTRKDLLMFWIRRWFRTLPNYVFVLIILIICKLIVYNDFDLFSLNYFLFIQNFASSHPAFFPEAWSLSIEEWFYLLFPVMVFIFHKMMKNKEKSLLYSALVFLIIPFIMRIIKHELKIGMQDFDEEYRKVVIYRLDSLMYGVLAAYAYLNQRPMWNKYKFISLFFGFAVMVLIANNPGNFLSFYEPFHFNIESIGVLLFIPFFSELKSTRIKLLDAFFIFISIISYSMYLINLTLVQGYLIPATNSLLGIAGNDIENTFPLNTFLFWVYTLLGSYLLYILYESRMTRLRDKVKLK